MRACLERVAKMATRPDAIGDQARSGLGHTFRTLVSAGALDLAEELIATVTAARGRYWPEALGSLGDALVYDVKALNPDAERRVRVLVTELTPNDMAERVRFLITEMPWDYPVDEQLDYHERNRRQIATIEALAEELLAQPDTLTGLLPELSQGEQRMGFQFGLALAKKAAEPLAMARHHQERLMSAAPSHDTQEFRRVGGMLRGPRHSGAGAACGVQARGRAIAEAGA